MVAVMMLSAAVLVQEKPRLDALVVNSASAPAAVVAAARITASAIFQRAGIDIDWFDRESIARKNRSLRSMYVVRIVAAAVLPSNSSGDRLGFAVIGSRIASVLYPAVESLATRTDSETSVVLGTVLAHELGHLLLGTSAHSIRGVMQATFDVLLAEQGVLRFTEDEVRTMHSRLDDPRLFP